VTVDSHGNLETAAPEPFFGVGSKPRDIKVFVAFGRVAVKCPLVPLLKIIDHDLLDARVDGVVLAFEIGFIGKKILEESAESLVDVA
jgi:hypothetical protein